jgi:hypothetical protein
LHEHACDEVNATFVTGLSACPVCDERLDIAPAFPSTVASYLKRTRASNKVNVTFDYETGAFVPVEDGEFVVVITPDQAIVLPRAGKFAAKRDFYEFYQDYYHCSNPDAGEVQIVEPAVVSPDGEGWALTGTGLLEIIKEQPKVKPKPLVAPVVPPSPPPPPVAVKREQPVAAPTPAPPVPAKEQPGARACVDCGSMIEAKYAFCWKCGHSMDEEHKPSVSNGRKPPTMLMSQAMDLDDELTIQHEPRPLSSTMLPWSTAAKTLDKPGRGSVLKLIGIGFVALTLLSLGLFGLLRSDTETASASVAAPPATQPSQPQPTVPITTEVSRNAPAETTTTQQAAPATPDDELQKLREKRMSAKPAERSKIFQALAKVERQYPRDYRFPYERAKLAVKGSQATSRNEAFKALNSAAEKAISTGKAGEMLNGLETDKAGDFSKLAQGRYEWSRLVAALKRKDPSLLGE